MTKHSTCDQCGSKDNLAIYGPDDYKCFTPGCTNFRRPHMTSIIAPTEVRYKTGTFRELQKRSLTKSICEKYNVFTVDHYDQPAIVFNEMAEGGRINCQQVRVVGDKKQMPIYGNKNQFGLLGKHLFEPSDRVSITITEGGYDMLSVAQVFAGKYPVVSLPNGAANIEPIKRELQYLSGFKNVVLCFDMDDAGIAAANKVAELFEPGKVKIVKLPMKDANDMLVAGRGEDLKKAVWNAREWTPAGIVKFDEFSNDEIQKLVSKGVSIPFPKLNNMIRGLKDTHLYTFVAREKAGKTTVTKEIVLHLLEQKEKIGLVYLEEKAAKAVVSLVAMSENTPMIDVEENLEVLGGVDGIQSKLKKFADSGLYIYKHEGNKMDPEYIMSVIRYMVKGLGCKFIVLDNLSIVIANSMNSANERTMIDGLVAKFVSFVQNTEATVLSVVHLVKNRKNKDGEDSEVVTRADIHGSGAFSKFSDVVIAIERDANKDHRVRLKVLANRDGGAEGYADSLDYNRQTGRLDLAEPTEDF